MGWRGGGMNIKTENLNNISINSFKGTHLHIYINVFQRICVVKMGDF